MNTKGAVKVIPIILTAITLATALFFYKQRQVLRQKTRELLSQSTKQTAAKPTEPTPSVANPPLAETPSPTVIPTKAGESSRSLENTRDDTGQPRRLSNAGTKTTTVCTPVYGMANTCAEHAVVDTALDTSIFYNLAGMSYIFGLGAFIKAKRA